jgi:hypothetical protein
MEEGWAVLVIYHIQIIFCPHGANKRLSGATAAPAFIYEATRRTFQLQQTVIIQLRFSTLRTPITFADWRNHFASYRLVNAEQE